MKYRIYALIHGQVLTEGQIFECEIRKMSFDEQIKRNFKPIQSIFSNQNDNDHKTYVTALPYIDPIKIKSEHVIVCNIEENSTEAAIGGAIKIIDRITRFLSLTCLEDIKKTFGRERGSFEPYIYQVNKIYLVDKNNKESDIKYNLKNTHIYLPDRPEQSDWRNSDTSKFLEEIYNFHDETLERALKYLYRSSIGYLVLDSKEKIALDHFKSIEIIVNSLGIKKFDGKSTSFKEKLKDVSEKIGITSDEKDRIENFWDERSQYGDIAHPSPFDEVERYPNQFPIPSNTRYSGGNFDSIAPSIILKYYQYIKSIFIINIDTPSEINLGKQGEFSKVYEISSFGIRNHNKLIYYTIERDKLKLITELKKAFIKIFNLDEEAQIEGELVPREKNSPYSHKVMLKIG